MRRDDAGIPAGLLLRAADGGLDLQLQRNDDLVAPGAKVVFVGGQAGERRSERPLRATAFKGSVTGEGDSDVRVTVEGRKVRGYVRRQSDVVVVEPSDGTATESHLLAAADDVIAAADPVSCGNDDATGAPTTTPRTTRAAAVPAGSALKFLDVSVVVDAQMWARLGNASVDAVQAVFNQVDGIYRREFGIAVQLRQVVVYTDAAAQPFATTGTDLGAVLSRLSLARQNDAAHLLSAGDVTHMFLGSDLGGAVGLAWVGGVCHRSWGASVTEVAGEVGYLTTIALAHELGHTLGAWHDGQPGSACEGVAKGQVMWPVLYSAMSDTFSTCSHEMMADNIAVASCLEDSIPVNCGNGVLDEGEECDDGNTAGGDCCRMNCTLDLPGVRCGDSGDACFDRVCDGGGSCSLEPNSAACDTGDACSLGRCEEGECRPTGEAPAFQSVVAQFRVDASGMLSGATLSATAPLAEGVASSLADAGLQVRVQVGGASIYQQYLPAGAWSDKGNGTYLYKAPSAVPGTIRKAKVVFSPAAGVATYRLQMATPNQAMAAEAPYVFLLAGGEADGQCSAGTPSSCTARGSKFVCQ